jgi:hypothetical protein
MTSDRRQHRQKLFRLNLGDCDWFGNAYARWPANSCCPAETGILDRVEKFERPRFARAFRVYQGSKSSSRLDVCGDPSSARAEICWVLASLASWFIFLDARRSDGRVRIFRE